MKGCFLLGENRVINRGGINLSSVVLLKSFFKKIDITDVFQFIGLVLIGTGLFFSCGLGISLTVVGMLLLSIGFFSGAIRNKK